MFNTRWRSLRGYCAAALFFALVAVVAIGAKPWAGQTVGPLDLLGSFPGWGKTVESSEIRSHERSDTLDFFIPQWTYARERLREGEVPLWNDTRAGGDSSLLNLTVGYMTPAFAIYAAAPDPALGFYLSVWFNLTVAGIGMFLFLRRHLTFVPALFGGVMFELCGFTAAWLYWTHVTTLIWAPWLLWAVDGAIRHRSPRWILATAVSTALLLLGGFPFVAELVLGAAVLYAVPFSFLMALSEHGTAQIYRNTIKRGIPAACGGALGFLLVLIPLIAFIQWLDQFNLGHRPSGSFMRLASHWNLLWPHGAFKAPRVEQAMYVGGLGALLGVLGFFAVGFRRWHGGYLGFYGLMLGVVAVVLTFQLVPVETLLWVPGLKGNGWSRAIAILDLSLAISAAVLLSKLLSFAQDRKFVIRAIAASLAGCLLLIQCYDQIRYFRAFNGESDSAGFFPRSALLDHVIRSKGPFDYVMADNAFIISGSLGGYGIREWFAHRFKTEKLRAVMPLLAEKPFTSPTASALRTANINADDPAIATMNVRYLLLHSGQETSAGKGVQGVADRSAMVPLPPMPGNTWRQPFSIDREMHVRDIALRLATYRATDVDGTIALEVLDGSGEILSRVEQGANGVVDNAYHVFPMPEQLTLAPGRYSFKLDYRPGSHKRKITVWSGASADIAKSTIVNGVATTHVIDYVVHPVRAKPQFKLVADNGLAALWENTRSPNGPYFVEDLARPDRRLSTSTRVDSYQTERFEISYSGQKSGYVVVPMEATKGWLAFVNDKPAAMESVLGVLPAVRVDGPSIIRFEYHQRALRWFWPWLACVAAALALLLFWHRRSAGIRQLAVAKSADR